MSTNTTTQGPSDEEICKAFDSDHRTVGGQRDIKAFRALFASSLAAKDEEIEGLKRRVKDHAYHESANADDLCALQDALGCPAEMDDCQEKALAQIESIKRGRDEAKGVPSAIGHVKAMGWSVDYALLEAVSGACEDEQVSMEGVEAVILELVKRGMIILKPTTSPASIAP